MCITPAFSCGLATGSIFFLRKSRFRDGSLQVIPEPLHFALLPIWVLNPQRPEKGPFRVRLLQHGIDFIYDLLHRSLHRDPSRKSPGVEIRDVLVDVVPYGAPPLSHCPPFLDGMDRLV